MINHMKNRIKILDIIIILLVTVLTFIAAYMVYFRPQERSQILIRGQDGEWTYPLNTEETVTVSGPLGDTIVRLHENSAWVESSPCDSQNCTAAGKINKQGQWTACLPNNVLILILGSKGDDVDSIAW
jgi:hypothetical protein